MGNATAETSMSTNAVAIPDRTKVSRGQATLLSSTRLSTMAVAPRPSDWEKKPHGMIAAYAKTGYELPNVSMFAVRSKKTVNTKT